MPRRTSRRKKCANVTIVTTTHIVPCEQTSPPPRVPPLKPHLASTYVGNVLKPDEINIKKAKHQRVMVNHQGYKYCEEDIPHKWRVAQRELHTTEPYADEQCETKIEQCNGDDDRSVCLDEELERFKIDAPWNNDQEMAVEQANLNNPETRRNSTSAQEESVVKENAPYQADQSQESGQDFQVINDQAIVNNTTSPPETSKPMSNPDPLNTEMYFSNMAKIAIRLSHDEQKLIHLALGDLIFSAVGRASNAPEWVPFLQYYPQNHVCEQLSVPPQSSDL